MNKKLKLLSIENLLYSYICFTIGFILFAKIFHIFLDFDFKSLKFLLNHNIKESFNFIFSGYSFIGGYIGGIGSIYLFSKLINIRFKSLIAIFLHSLLLMYGILKIGCFINGCCIGKYDFPIQIIESIISLVIYGYIFLNLMKYKENKLIGISIFSFGLSRFLISFFRIYSNIYSFIIVEIICLIFIVIGISNFSLNLLKKV